MKQDNAMGTDGARIQQEDMKQDNTEVMMGRGYSKKI